MGYYLEAYADAFLMIPLTFFFEEKLCYFIVSDQISAHLMKIKVVSIISKMTDTIYILTHRFGLLRFSSLFQKQMLPSLQIY